MKQERQYTSFELTSQEALHASILPYGPIQQAWEKGYGQAYLTMWNLMEMNWAILETDHRYVSKQSWDQNQNNHSAEPRTNDQPTELEV